MKHFHQGFAPCFLRRELEEQICMFLFEDSGFLKVFTRSRGPPGSVGIQPAFSLWNSHMLCFFFVGLARRQVCREVGSRGDIWAKMEGFIPAANIRSAPEWRLVSDVQGELASHFVFGSSRRNSSFPRRHTLLLCTCDLFPVMHREWCLSFTKPGGIQQYKYGKKKKRPLTY